VSRRLTGVYRLGRQDRAQRPIQIAYERPSSLGSPWRGPIKTHLRPRLASNYIFLNAGAAPALCGGAMVGPPDSVSAM
jgi:hypothetical protein